MGDDWDSFVNRAAKSKDVRIEMKKRLTAPSKSPLQIAAARIKNGEPVADTYLKGHRLKELLEFTDVTQEDIDKYIP